MECMDRKGNKYRQDDTQSEILRFLYKNKLGRIILKPLINPWVTNLSEAVMNSRFSRIFIPLFIRKYKIDMNEFENRTYYSYNDFFTRKIKKGKRLIDENPKHLIAPCDGKLSVYPINKSSQFTVKNTTYNLRSLLRSKKLADFYENGTLLIFRLTVDDYHRYCYIDSGRKSKNYRINGVFHTVNPVANDVVPVYKENTREYSILYSENFGKILIMEVGALLVGRIVNYHEKAYVKRGQEKGRFEFGGSTVIVCLEKDRAVIDIDIIQNSLKGIETLVRMGEKIGIAQEKYQ
ncbi:phosphatidylserine decarboxylase [Herbinix hemicellulosilytica]|uniref:Phosphatidylserine decarboxylase proenzyme 2 n=1 Tax=Herbinix hemicellulosilytica TaxID=1564487 RepID=A0A0H5SUT4_HERHM|nr:phosphatidylserine decarboxylase [Herbinix hemicellulosilytica]RBP58346.1 phosphatidylserine decarboxylase [Herbinix hemicellulosilytica]CRZ34063.1 Phosphatidylserine decarboxylase proenzyme 2 [Herbinix hemicellulosilytica]